VAAPMIGAGYAGARQLSGAPTQMAGRTAAVPPYMYGAEDGGPGGPPRRQRRAWPWVVLLVVVVVLIAAIAAIKFINGGNSGVSVPTVSGESVTAAKTALVKAGLVYGGTKDEFSSTTPKGKVIGTSPSAGSSASKGSDVTLLVSEGTKPSKTVKVPNVVGERRGAAYSKLTSDGFKVDVVPASSPPPGTPPNTVVSQSPQAGTPVKPGDTITINVTAKALTVPSSVLGKTQAQASAILEGPPWDCSMVIPNTTSGGGQGPVGTVYATDPGVGQPLQQGCQITIFIVGSASSSPPPSGSPSPSNSPSPSPSNSSSPPPGQVTTGQGTNGQSTPSPATSGNATNGISDDLSGLVAGG
jgi:eukaryotic-like serine/threonine-protein kinase